MGIIGFFKQGLRQLAIARGDEHKDLWVYKHPDRTIPMGAQLTVDQDETALFFRDGTLVVQLGPGRHTLEAKSMPILGRLVAGLTGGNVFLAELFFVNTREMAGVKFGTSVGELADPQTGLRVRLMAHGEFSAKIFDPVKLVTGLVGLGLAEPSAHVNWFRSQVQKTLKDDIAALIVKQGWPVMRLTSGAYTEELERQCLAGVRRHIEPYGVEIIRFGDFTIALDPKDRDRLDRLIDKAAHIHLAGGVEGYRELAHADMMISAGEGLKRGSHGAGALAGTGIGPGVAIAGELPSATTRGADPLPATAHAAEATPPLPPPLPALCSACGARAPGGKYCSACGAPMPAAEAWPCDRCGKPMSGRFCLHCGAPGNAGPTPAP